MIILVATIFLLIISLVFVVGEFNPTVRYGKTINDKFGWPCRVHKWNPNLPIMKLVIHENNTLEWIQLDFFWPERESLRYEGYSYPSSDIIHHEPYGRYNKRGCVQEPCHLNPIVMDDLMPNSPPYEVKFTKQ